LAITRGSKQAFQREAVNNIQYHVGLGKGEQPPKNTIQFVAGFKTNPFRLVIVQGIPFVARTEKPAVCQLGGAGFDRQPAGETTRLQRCTVGAYVHHAPTHFVFSTEIFSYDGIVANAAFLRVGINCHGWKYYQQHEAKNRSHNLEVEQKANRALP